MLQITIEKLHTSIIDTLKQLLYTLKADEEMTVKYNGQTYKLFNHDGYGGQWCYGIKQGADMLFIITHLEKFKEDTF